MKTTHTFLLVVAALELITCKKTSDTQPVACQQPTMVIAQGPCENVYANGVVLKASGYTEDPDYPSQFIYTIYPQKDTTSNNITVSSYANASNDQIIIPLEKLNGAAKFIVAVAMSCRNRASNFSTNFAFVKRQTANPACYVWALQKN